MNQLNRITPQVIGKFIKAKTGATQVDVKNLKSLSGGAIQQNIAFDAHITGGQQSGMLKAVLRADAPSVLSISHSRQQEFVLFKRLYEAGVRVPEPLWLGDKSVFGSDFFIMKRVEGTAAAHRLVKDMSLGGDRKQLVETLGEQMALIHQIQPPDNQLDFLPLPSDPVALELVKRNRTALDNLPNPYPALEWALCWLVDNVPQQSQLSLCHRDFRTGNYMVDENGLTGILDLEFANWSDPLEDIGWFCAKCWRFGKNDLEAGGIGSREDFYRGYERISDKRIAKENVHYWEVMAHVNWAVIAAQQAYRHTSAKEPSLTLALTGHIVPKLEQDILTMI